ncbi:hypothetical protein Tco_0957430, partial [Tanacetum coccineum]
MCCFALSAILEQLIAFIGTVLVGGVESWDMAQGMQSSLLGRDGPGLLLFFFNLTSWAWRVISHGLGGYQDRVRSYTKVLVITGPQALQYGPAQLPRHATLNVFVVLGSLNGHVDVHQESLWKSLRDMNEVAVV